MHEGVRAPDRVQQQRARRAEDRLVGVRVRLRGRVRLRLRGRFRGKG